MIFSKILSPPGWATWALAISSAISASLPCGQPGRSFMKMTSVLLSMTFSLKHQHIFWWYLRNIYPRFLHQKMMMKVFLGIWWLLARNVLLIWAWRRDIKWWWMKVHMGASLSIIFISMFLEVGRWTGPLVKCAIGIILPSLCSDQVCKFQYAKQLFFFLPVYGGIAKMI